MKNNKKSITVFIVLVCLLVIVLVSASYAMFSATLVGTKENKLTTGTVLLNCTETNFTLSDTKAMTDAQGIALTNNSATCTLTSTMRGTMNIGYDIALYDVDIDNTATTGIDESSDSLGESNVKIQVSKSIDNGTVIYVKGSSSTGVLVSSIKSVAGQYDSSITGYTVDSATLTGNHSILYTIKGWVASGGEGSSSTIVTDGKCSINDYSTKSECEAANGIWGYDQTKVQNGGSFSFKLKVGASQI